MRSLDLRNTVSEMQNSLDGLNCQWDILEGERSVNLKRGQQKLSKLKHM